MNKEHKKLVKRYIRLSAEKFENLLKQKGLTHLQEKALKEAAEKRVHQTSKL